MAELRPARRAVAVVFFVYGGVFATWVSRIPLIKQELGLDNAHLSLALLGSLAGLILAMGFVAPLVGRWSSATVTRGAVLAACVSVVLPALAWNLGSLGVALFLLRMSLGTLDIAMNTQGVGIERGYARPIMSGIHGVFSVGVLVGAGLGALAAHAGVDPLLHFTVAAVCLAALGIAGSRALLGAEVDAASEPDLQAGAPLRLSRHPSLVALGVIAFCCLFAEGAVDDWSGVYCTRSRARRWASPRSAPRRAGPGWRSGASAVMR